MVGGSSQVYELTDILIRGCYVILGFVHQPKVIQYSSICCESDLSASAFPIHPTLSSPGDDGQFGSHAE